jgi:hypothetical protein
MEVDEGKYWGAPIDGRPFSGCQLLCSSCNTASSIADWEEDEYWCDDCTDTHYCYVCPKCHDYFGPSTGGRVTVLDQPAPAATAPLDTTQPRENHVRDAVNANR